MNVSANVENQEANICICIELVQATEETNSPKAFSFSCTQDYL